MVPKRATPLHRKNVLSDGGDEGSIQYVQTKFVYGIIETDGFVQNYIALTYYVHISYVDGGL